MKISYYELLGMIKEGNAPKRIKVKACSYPCEYVANYDGAEFNYYYIADEELEDENYEYYLSECFIESMMFDKCIEIIEEVEEDEFEDIEELNLKNIYKCDDYQQIYINFKHTWNKINALIKNQKKIIEQLKNKD